MRDKSKTAWRKQKSDEPGPVLLQGDIYVERGLFEGASDIVELTRLLAGDENADLVMQVSQYLQNASIHVFGRRQRRATIHLTTKCGEGCDTFVLENLFVSPEVRELCAVAGVEQ